MRAVHLDRANGDEELLADLLIRLAERDKMDNVALRCGEQREARIRISCWHTHVTDSRRGVGPVAFEQAADDLLGRHSLALGHRGDSSGRTLDLRATAGVARGGSDARPLGTGMHWVARTFRGPTTLSAASGSPNLLRVCSRVGG